MTHEEMLILDFVKDHFEHYGFYPLTYETEDGKIIGFKGIMEAIIKLEKETEETNNAR